MKNKNNVTIDTDALIHNAAVLKQTVGDFYCVLKCDAYGHGARTCAKALYGAEMTHFAVFSLSEALDMRPYVGESEILILGRTPAPYAPCVTDNGFVQTVFSEEYARELAPFSNGMRVHIKLDTGMNRSGFKCSPEEVKKAFSDFQGAIEGVYTHFHNADGNSLFQTEKQLNDFLSKAQVLDGLFSKKLVRHAAASAAALRMDRARLDLCRIGLALYGCLPDNCEGICVLRPVMSFRGRIISVRNVKKGENIGYGCDHTAKNDMTVATVALGYANGLPRNAEKTFRPSIAGERVPFCARICMDRCMLDVTRIVENGGKIKPYDEAEFFGKSISVSEFSQAEGTIPYETLTRVGRMNKI